MSVIQVTASAAKEVIPDRTKLILTHKAHRYDYEELCRAVAAEKNVISSAIAHCTDAKIIIESAYTAPVYNYGEKKHSRVNDGYEYVGRYSIDIALDAKLLDDLTLALTALGLNIAIGTNDYYKDADKLSDCVTAEAIREAAAKARVIARELNEEITAVEKVEYSSARAPMLMRAAYNDGGYERKPIVVSECVTVSFETRRIQ